MILLDIKKENMLHEQLKTLIKEAVKSLYAVELSDVDIEHPDLAEFGDFSSNVSFKLARILKQSPLDIANKLTYEIVNKPLTFDDGGQTAQIFKKIEALSPGFINFYLSNEWLKNVPDEVNALTDDYGSSFYYKKRKILVEFTDPNPFKVFHIGHLMTNTIGESLARITEYLGADVRRANYQGDVGMHVAKSIWGFIKNTEDDNLTLQDLQEMELGERITYLGKSYSRGANAFKDDADSAEEIKALNVLIFCIAQKVRLEVTGSQPVIDYEKLLQQDKIPFDRDLVEEIYFKGRIWSLAYFETLYARLGTEFDNYYFESVVAEKGYEFVIENIENGIFERDNGAVVYKGEKDGLHTRVFINSIGLPVYEAKDLGLAFIKYQDFAYDKSLIITGNEINSYFQVVLSAMSKINADLAAKTTHLGHGMLRLKEGKMSSRTGSVIAGDALLNELKERVLQKMAESETTSVPKEQQAEIADRIAVASIKYTILKNGIGNDIVFDKEEVLSLTGNTGPYLLYAYARTNSVIDSSGVDLTAQKSHSEVVLTDLELSILRHIYKLEEVVLLAGERLSPNLIATFAFDLAQKFNTYYAEVPIIKTEDENVRYFRLQLTSCVRQVLKNSLNLLGIRVVDRM